jgi:asparagine synthase (glutamine-hydrolysing)
MAEGGRQVRSYSIAFELPQGEEGELDKFNRDALLAEKTARQYGALHTTYTLTLPELRTQFDSMLTSMDEPVANPTMIAQYVLSAHVRKDGVVVTLGGDGGDELFLGYTRHRMLMAAYYFKQLPGVLQSMLGRLNPRIHKMELPFGSPLHLSVMANKTKLLTPCLSPSLTQGEVVRTYFTDAYEGVHQNHPLTTFAQIDRRTWLPEESLHRSDQTSMAHGLELRVPLLDQCVVAYADTIPVSKKLTPWQGKRILRDTYRTHLPEHLFHEPKRGWQSPGAKWLRDPVIEDLARTMLTPQYYDGVAELYDWSGLQKMLTDHIEKRSYALYPLWNSVALNAWARKHAIKF